MKLMRKIFVAIRDRFLQNHTKWTVIGRCLLTRAPEREDS